MTTFAWSEYEENEKRKVIARELREIPFSFQKLIINTLNNNGRRTDLFATCITCEHWDDAVELCKLANKRPPAKVIADGCTSYVDIDLIPF
jgi:hypothetical protein